MQESCKACQEYGFILTAIEKVESSREHSQICFKKLTPGEELEGIKMEQIKLYYSWSFNEGGANEHKEKFHNI